MKRSSVWIERLGCCIGTALAMCVLTPGVAAAASAAQTTFDDAKALGKQQAQNGMANLRNGQSLGTAQRIPGYNSNPSQTQYYSNQDLAGGAAQVQSQCVASPSDPTCSAIAKGMAPRPANSSISVSDPALGAQAVVDDPSLVLGNITQTYNACAAGGSLVSAAQFQRQSCTLDTAPWTNKACDKTLEIHPASTNCTAGPTLASATFYRTGGPPDTIIIKATCNSTNTPDAVPFTFTAFGASGSCAAPLSVTVDLSHPNVLGPNTPPIAVGQVVPHWLGFCMPLVVMWEGTGCVNNTCNATFHLVQAPGIVRGQGGAWSWAPGQHVSQAVSFVQPYVHATGDTWGGNCGPFEQVTPGLQADGINSSTPPAVASIMNVGDPQCVRTSSICTSGPSTQVVNGQSFTRGCWAYHDTFACTALSSSTCGAAPLQGCTTVGPPQCLLEDGAGHCLKTKQDYDCKTANAQYTASVNCGNASFCANGSCWDTASTPNTSFAYTIAQLEAHVEAGKDFDKNNLQIFKGADNRCGVTTFGIDNCCSDSAYIVHCSQAEKDLFNKREQGKCHEVGKYCSSKVLGICHKNTHTSCCFSSLLARLVQEQGRAQISRSWGTPQAPNCQGFTPDELAALDWSQFDLSEFYAQIHYTPPDPAQMSNGVQNQQTSCYYGQGKC